MKEGRSGDWNRGVMGEFVTFLAKEKVNQLGIVAGDMNKLKSWNDLDTKTGDLSILTNFYTCKFVGDRHDAVLFIPNEGGGDDIVLLTANATEEHLQALQDELEQTLSTTNEHLLDTWDQGQLYNREFKFISSVGENKKSSPAEVARLRAVSAAGKLPTLSATFVHTLFPLQPIRDNLEAQLPIAARLEPFFAVFHDLHNQIEEKKHPPGTPKDR